MTSSPIATRLMRSTMRCAIGVLALHANTGAALSAPYILTQKTASAASATPGENLLERGAYLARAGDCVACHTPPGGKPFAGGLAMQSPFGTIYSTNITPDPEHGIGRYTYAEFSKAVSQGITRDGKRLYPAMPYPSFAKMTDSDMRALYVYFTQGVAPVSQPNKPTELRWPFSIRALMIGWNMFYARSGPYAPNPSMSPDWNRGAYLVQGLGHCGACHTPRGIASQEAALSDKDGPDYLRGNVMDNWFAPNLANSLQTGLRAWGRRDIADYLKTGRTTNSAAFGAMADVVHYSTQHLSESDLLAIATYLKSMPGETQPDATDRSVQLSHAGARLYLDNCNACHRSDGTGAPRTFPRLAGNEMVNSPDPTSLIHLVLKGGAMPTTGTTPSALAMPDFGWRLSDREVADVLTFVRSSWGNDAPPVSANAVAKVRKAVAGEKPQRVPGN